MLPRLVATTLSSIGLALLLAAHAPLPASAAWHLAFAAGAMPLIFAAMLHFAPVLTRGRSAGALARAVPVATLGAGWLAATSMAHPALGATGLTAAALVALSSTVGLLAWLLARARDTLGAPHPGLYWYIAALACLLIALIGALAMPLLPHARPALRLLHLHLNTLGFIGLTALGTLQVLLPTALARADPEAARRLRTDWPAALAGALLLAFGAAVSVPLLGVTGAALLIGITVRLLHRWFAGPGWQALRDNGAALSLAAATAAFAALLGAGALHAFGWLPGAHMTPAFVLAFVLPLVCGAASQLLPVWLRPGAQGPWHARCREQLGRFAAARVGAFLAAGAAAAAGLGAAAWIALAALAGFAVQVALALRARA